LEVKDPNFGDIWPKVAEVASYVAVTAGLGQVFSSMYAEAGLSATSAAASSTTGGVTVTSIPAASAAGTVQTGSAASIAGRATAAALISAARGGTVGDAFKAAVMAGGSDFLANSDIVKSTVDSLKGYLGIPSEVEIELVLDNPVTQAAASGAASVLSNIGDVIFTGKASSGASAGVFCIAPPCEPGTIFVGNALSSLTSDEAIQQVILAGTPGTSAAGAAAGITPEQFWDEFKNQWYNYKPEDGETTDPNANLPGFEILPNDSEPLKLAKALANSFNDAIFPRS
jgi:hypothetical protein